MIPTPSFSELNDDSIQRNKAIDRWIKRCLNSAGFNPDQLVLESKRTGFARLLNFLPGSGKIKLKDIVLKSQGIFPFTNIARYELWVKGKQIGTNLSFEYQLTNRKIQWIMKESPLEGQQ